MENTTDLRDSVKNWLQIDIEIKQLQKEIKRRRTMKKDITNRLIDTMKTNDIDVMNIPDGRLVRTSNRVKAPLSKRHLVESLLLYFKEDQEMVKSISSHIMDTRKVKVVERIQKKK
jgi:hypothetical protein|uniref:Uncharacterized protein n=1 Tax=viral metagenome TaxID=1070528 RepID=A0A6C0IR36_9ZZZZ